MPTYEYRCLECGHRFERTERMSQHGTRTPSCPKCRTAKVAVALSPFFAKTSRKS
jgi:putative FmdB family regulatory protein